MSRHFPAITPAANIKIVSQTFGGGRLLNSTVLIDGEYYTVNEYLLAALRRGATVDELELEPEEPEDEFEDEYSLSASAADRIYQARREQQS